MCLKLELNHTHVKKGVGLIPAGGPVVDEFFSTVPSWFFDMCMIQLELKTHLPFRIYPISSQMPQNLNMKIKPFG